MLFIHLIIYFSYDGMLGCLRFFAPRVLPLTFLLAVLSVPGGGVLLGRFAPFSYVKLQFRYCQIAP